MLAIGRKRLSRCKKIFGGKDRRSLPRHLDATKPPNHTMTIPFTKSFSSSAWGDVGRSAAKSTSVRGFFVHLYWTAGEPMTKEKHVCISLEKFEVHWLRFRDLKHSVLRIASKQLLANADDCVRDEILQRLIDARLLGPSMQIAFNHTPDTLPLRELPHGSWSELYLLYQAFVKSKATGGGEVEMASRATFFAEAQRWHTCLKFHQKTHHAQCFICSRLRAALQNATDTCHLQQPWNFGFGNFKETLSWKLLPLHRSTSKDFAASAKISSELLHHYAQSWRDREVYWLARERAKVQGDVCVMILDSYDHAKMVLPKWPMSRTPKKPVLEQTPRAMAQYIVCLFLVCRVKVRNWWFFEKSCAIIEYWFDSSLGTSLTLTGCIVHGFGVYFFLGDEGMPSGSNWTLERALWLQTSCKSLALHSSASSSPFPGDAKHWPCLGQSKSFWLAISFGARDLVLEAIASYWYLQTLQCFEVLASRR